MIPTGEPYGIVPAGYSINKSTVGSMNAVKST
jgi:hypothetical protein